MYMPLSAKINGQVFYSTSLSSTILDNIKKNNTRIIMPCCGCVGHLRKGISGKFYFVHNPNQNNNCERQGETIEHQEAKYEIAKNFPLTYTISTQKFSQNSTIYCQPEYRLPNSFRIADIFLENNSSKLIVEVQWSRQTLEETQKRTEDYRKAGVDCIWLFRKLPFGYEECDLNIYKLTREKNVFNVELAPNKKITLETFACYLGQYLTWTKVESRWFHRQYILGNDNHNKFSKSSFERVILWDFFNKTGYEYFQFYNNRYSLLAINKNYIILLDKRPEEGSPPRFNNNFCREIDPVSNNIKFYSSTEESIITITSKIPKKFIF